MESAPVRPASWTDVDEKVLQLMARLQKEKGAQIYLVTFPSRSRVTNAIRLSKMRYAAAVLGVPYYDMNAQIPQDEPLEFSDAVHLRCKYALRVAATLYGLVHR